MPLLLSVPLPTFYSTARLPPTVFLDSSRRDNRGLGDVCPVSCLHRDAKPSFTWQLIAYSSYAYKSLSLSYLFVSARFPPPINILSPLHLPSRVSRIEISYFRSSPETMDHHQSVRLQFFYTPHLLRFLTYISLMLLFSVSLSPCRSTILAYHRHPLVSPEF